jgi:hypothetical protein
MSYFNEEANNGNDIVNLFKSYFSSVYEVKPVDISINNISPDLLDPINEINMDINDIFNELWFIKLNTCPSTDEIAPIFLKECSFIITPVLHFLFNKSLHTGVFPDKWKTSFISPIYKNKNKNLVQNYRPISKISCIPKLFSKLINKKLMPLCNNILINEQHGFRKGRSTITNLCVFKESILESFKEKTQTDVIYTDLEKAFDKVNHN